MAGRDGPDDGGDPRGDDEGDGAHGPRGDDGSDGDPVCITHDLLAVLLDRAATAEPDGENVVLGATPAGAFDRDLGLASDHPILTHLYLPEAGGSVRAVFGVDLGRPAGGGVARFVSHPQGPLDVTERDDLAAVVVVAVPPWTPDGVAAFDRSGRRRRLRVVDEEPPVEGL